MYFIIKYAMFYKESVVDLYGIADDTHRGDDI